MTIPLMYPKNQFYQTCRTLHARCCMIDLTDDRFSWLFAYVIHHYAAVYGVLIHAVSVLPDHIHIACTDRNGVYGDFLRDTFSRLAAGINHINGTVGRPVWESQEEPFRVYVPEGDFECMAAHTAYTMLNSFNHRYTNQLAGARGQLTPFCQIGEEGLQLPRPDFYFSSRTKLPAEVTMNVAVPLGISKQQWMTTVAAFAMVFVLQHCDEPLRPLPKKGHVPRRRRRKRRKRHQGKGSRLMRMFGGSTLQSRIAMIRRFFAFQVAYRDAHERWDPTNPDFDVVFPAETGALRRYVPVAELECRLGLIDYYVKKRLARNPDVSIELEPDARPDIAR